MYKVSVPINLNTVTEETLPIHLKAIRDCGAQRVFLGGMGHVYTANSRIRTNPEWVKTVIRAFQAQGQEVGLWISAFGHGSILAHDKKHIAGDRYTSIEGVDGKTAEHGFCPLDENFRHDYAEAMQIMASFHPDIIMLDDDFRMNLRKKYYDMGCFCPLHLKRYYEMIGEEVPREKLEALIFTGGKNKYRDAYMQLSRESLLDFAKMLRRAVDEVDSRIRLGASISLEIWDYSGTDPMELAKAFAGSTEPFTRVAGAPYWNINIIPIFDLTRQELFWGRDSGVEMFTEGDTYPRPRYNVPSKTLELFDFVMLADGTSNGMLHYLFDYVQHPEYETGYAKRYIRNAPLRAQIREMFDGKQSVGVEAFAAMHKLQTWQLPDQLTPKTAGWLQNMPVRPASSAILGANSIPTTMESGEYPVLLIGENARHIPVEGLKNGAILDIDAAKILQSRGIDTGLLSAQPAAFEKEAFPAAGDAVNGIGAQGMYRVTCGETAQVLSRFLPDETPAVYRYENGDGQRFVVMAFAYYTPNVGFNANYLSNYYRQAQLVDAIPWLCGKKLPAVTLKNPNVYVLTKKNENAMAVALANVHLDDVLQPQIKLDKAYGEIRFLNCSGKLEGDTVTLSDIPPYGFAAFEVK